MKMHLSKGQTITPALIPIPNPIAQTVDVVGFSGLSELDYVATHILCAMLVDNDDFEDIGLISKAVNLAQQLLNETNKINEAQRNSNS